MPVLEVLTVDVVEHERLEHFHCVQKWSLFVISSCVGC